MIPLGIAAGHFKRPDQMEPLLRVPHDILETVTFGSFTPAPRVGNTGGTNFWEDQETGTTLNSLGLPNPGIYAACEFLPEVGKKLADNGQYLRVSIAGFRPEDYVSMAKMLQDLDIENLELELNLGCPNVRDGHAAHPIIAFDPDLVREIVNAVYEAGVPNIGVKLSPYSDPMLLRRVATELRLTKRGALGNVVDCNTFPNGSAFDGAKLALDVADGYGGIAGMALHEIMLGQVRQLSHALGSVPIIAVGGIRDGRTVRNAELAGACAAQIGSAFFSTEDLHLFQSIANDYLDVCEKEAA